MRRVLFFLVSFLFFSCNKFISLFEDDFPIMESKSVKEAESLLKSENVVDFSTYIEKVQLEDAKEYEEMESLVWYTSSAKSLGASFAKKGGTFYTYLHDFPNTFCYTGLQADKTSKKFFQNHTPLLVRSFYDRAFLPALATHWAFGNDGKSVYYKLNLQARWSDGAPCVADDFVFAIDFMHSKEILKLGDDSYSHLSIKKISEEYIMIRFEAKIPASEELLLEATNIMPRARHFYNGLVPENWIIEYNRKAEPTTGAYYLDEWDFNYGLIFKKVPNWWAESYEHFQNMFNFDTIEVRILPGTQVSVRKYFRSEKLDAIPLSSVDEYFSAREDARFRRGMADIWKVKINSVQGLNAIVLNTKKPPLDNLYFRRALEYAIDIDGLIENVLSGEVARCTTMGENQGCDGILFNNKQIKLSSYDREKAIYLLEKAGFDEVDRSGIRRNKKGERATFTLLYQDINLKDVAGYLYARAFECGIEIDFQFCGGGILDKIKDGKFQGWWSNFASSNMPKNYHILHSPSSSPAYLSNIFAFSDAKMDLALEEYESEMKDMKRKAELNKQIEAYAREKALFIPTYYANTKASLAWKYIRLPNWHIPLYIEDVCEYFAPFAWFDPDIKEDVERAFEKNYSFETREWKN